MDPDSIRSVDRIRIRAGENGPEKRKTSSSLSLHVFSYFIIKKPMFYKDPDGKKNLFKSGRKDDTEFNSSVTAGCWERRGTKKARYLCIVAI
jgi:hypothetical protein